MYNHTNYFDFTKRRESINRDNTMRFLSPEQAIARGNVEKKKYLPYKNIEPLNLNFNLPTTGFKQLIQAYYFTLNDLTLYLDVHPNDEEALAYYNQVLKKLNELMASFNKSYYPLFIFSKEQSIYEWSKLWPWNGRTS